MNDQISICQQSIRLSLSGSVATRATVISRPWLTQKLNVRSAVVAGMICYYHLAVKARRMGISCENDPETFKQEALNYAKMFGDCYIHLYNKHFHN